MKSGFVAVVGRSNAGKSTLLNTMVGTKIAITTPKPQTTRHAIQGVLHAEGGQIVFVDTPGILKNRSRDRLTAKLNQAAKDALQDVDLVLYVVDPTRAIGPEEEQTMTMVKGAVAKIILVINKIDEKKLPYLEDYRALAPEFDASVEVSALKGTHFKTLTKLILERLPEGEPLYPPDQITNLDNKTWYAELIREKVFMSLYQEVPYSTHVEVDEIETRMTKAGETLCIKARILTDTDAHKRILIGAGGSMIKSIGTTVRKELEQIHGKKVFIDLDVETDPHWPERIG